MYQAIDLRVMWRETRQRRLHCYLPKALARWRLFGPALRKARGARDRTLRFASGPPAEGRQGQAWAPWVDTIASTASRLNEAGFWRGGNLAKFSICAATVACMR